MYASRPNRIFLCMIRLLPFFCVLLFGTNCSDNSTHPPEFALELQQEMDLFLDDKMSEYNIPGALIGIFVPGRGTCLKAKGKADIEANKDMNLTHTLRIGSISKTFNATIILQLVDEGLLNLEDTSAIPAHLTTESIFEHFKKSSAVFRNHC